MIGLIKEIIRRKSLIKELVVKDLKIRYSRPLLGFFWAFLSPLSNVFIFYIVFSLFLKVKIEEGPFVLYLMTGIFPWRFFQDSLMGSVSSLTDNKHLIRESHFPHFLIPLSIVLANFINFIPSLLLLILTSLIILKGLPYFFLLLPFIVSLHIIIAIAVSIIFSILYVRWRDSKYILEIMLSFLFYLTPVFYSVSLIRGLLPPLLYKAYIYNPFVGLMNLYRLSLFKNFSSVFQNNAFSLTLLSISVICFAGIALWLAFFYSKKNEAVINDYLSY